MAVAIGHSMAQVTPSTRTQYSQQRLHRLTFHRHGPEMQLRHSRCGVPNYKPYATRPPRYERLRVQGEGVVQIPKGTKGHGSGFRCGSKRRRRRRRVH